MFNITEKLYLEMCNNFQTRMNKKNSELIKLKKILLTVYGLVRRADNSEDIGLLQEARAELSEWLHEEMNWDTDDIPIVNIYAESDDDLLLNSR